MNSPRVVAKEAISIWVEDDPLAVHAHPTGAAAGHLIGHPFAYEAAVDARGFDRIQIGQRGAPTGHVQLNAEVVRLQDEPDHLERLDDL